MKKLILIYLAFLSKKIIKKHKPFVIGVTGTVGKTTTTNFVFEFLSKIYPGEVYMSPYDYNGEFGLPLTILQSKSPNKNIILWILILFKTIYLFFNKKYPKYLVLEYGIDHIGEMQFLIDVVRPDIAILLNISPNHVTQFPDYKDYINEKILLGKKAKTVIYNIDDENLRDNFLKETNSYSFSYNNPDANIFAKEVNSTVTGLNFSICNKEKCIEVTYSILGDHQIYNLLPVYLLGENLNISIEKVKEILSEVHPQKGRGTLIKGVHDSIIIDGSYNGGFLSISSGVKYIQNLQGNFNKILFLGEMRELGTESKKMHLELANLLMKGSFDYLVLVGDEMKNYVFDKVSEIIGTDKIFFYKNSKDAGNKVRNIIKCNEKQSIIYVKGSQNTIFLEEGIKKFLFNMQDSKLLCRQSDKWLRIKEDFFSHIL